MSATALAYRSFAEVEAHGRSPVYEEWAQAIAADDSILELIEALPERKRQPNLVFAAARFSGAPIGPYDRLRPWLRSRWREVERVVRARSTQTNEAGRCAVLLPALAAIPGPIALIEVGASAGLCLIPDRYSYRYRTAGADVRLDPDDGLSVVVLDCSIAGTPCPRACLASRGVPGSTSIRSTCGRRPIWRGWMR